MLLTGNNDGTTGLGADCWLTCVTDFDGIVDNKWVSAANPNTSFQTWMTALEHLRYVPRAMSNKYHTGQLFAALIRAGKMGAHLAKPMLLSALRGAARGVAHSFASHLAGTSPTAAEGVKLLARAYGIGNEITSKLEGGGS